MHVLLDASDRHIFFMRMGGCLYLLAKIPLWGLRLSAQPYIREFFVDMFLHLHQCLEFFYIFGGIAFKDG